MQKEINFTFYTIKKNFQSSKELRVSFIASLIGMALNNSSFLIIWMAFGNIAGNMNNWQSVDVLCMLGIGTIGYGLAFAFFGGIRELPDIIAAGNFDKYLLSPKNVLLRISTSTFSASAIGDLLFGVICVATWFYLTTFTWAGLLMAIFFSLLCGLLYFFFSVFINSSSFYFHDSRPIVQGLFEFLITPSIFYGGAFEGILRNLFIFLIPALLLGTIPVEAIRNLDIGKLLLELILVCIWGVLSIWVFNRSIRKYESSNFVSFG